MYDYNKKKLLSISIVLTIIVGFILYGIFFGQDNIVNDDEREDQPEVPIVKILSPSNTIYYSAVQELRISASDNKKVDTVWYNWDGKNKTYTSPLDITFHEGFNILYAWANDSDGKIGSDSVAFTINTTISKVEIITPTNETYYSAKLTLDITATANSEIDTIWYNWNGTDAIYNSSTEVVFSEGFNILRAWANDTSGNTSTDSVSFTIVLEDFTSVWNTSKTDYQSTENNQIKLPLVEDGFYDFTVRWGDGTNNTITKWNATEVLHEYNESGVYKVIINGTIKGWSFNNKGDKLKLVEIMLWDNLLLGNTGGYFYGCANLKITAVDDLRLWGTTNLQNAFRICESISNVKNINDWDVSHVQNMNSMFSGADSFNEDIGGWDVSNVITMESMFHGTKSFNHPIGNWDVSRVINMRLMFSFTSVFNQPLNEWNVSNVEDMSCMFRRAYSFNQPIGNWDVSKVQTMESMFCEGKFNQPIGNWDVSNVINMKEMFYSASSFNQLLEDWDV
jgi:surface protein